MRMLIKSLKIILIVFISSSLCLQSAFPQAVLPTPKYISLIQQKVNTFFVYPTEAENKGWEGIVKVRFTLGPDGRIKDIDVAESSGYPLLDAAAMLAVRDASPYPFPEDIGKMDEDTEIILPVNFMRPKEWKPADKDKFRSSLYNKWKEPLAVKIPKDTQNEQKAKALAQAMAQSKIQTQIQAPAKDKKEKETYPPPEQKTEEQAPIIVPDEAEEISAPLVEADREETSQETGKKEEPKDLPYFIEVALRNNQPTKVARQEIELAQLKVTEAKRNLFPTFKTQAYHTDGDVYKVDYHEEEVKVQLDQPIFYGGRLVNTTQQSRVNLEITKKNYDRLKLDVIQKAETAYYNLVAAKIHLGQKEDIRQEAQALLNKIEHLSKIGMAIPLEVTSSRSWLRQIDFQIDSIKQDLYMAELTFKQVLNIKDTPIVNAKELEAKPLDLSLDKCLEIAYKNRPEIYLSQLLVKFNDFGQRVESNKKNSMTVDFSGSYGYYRGAYKTEPMKQSNNWYVGVKASQPWGANTMNAAYSQEHSQPRFGQTSPTASRTVSGEFSILDNLKRLSDKKKADIDLNRSISDFDESLKTITFEVQDAFLNYQKAVLQLKASKAEMQFRRNEAKVTEIRSMVGEVSLSNSMEAYYSLSEAQTKYIQALSNYQLSLANLKKATGYGLAL
ncbi:MAG: TonB family protein [Candidatus Omnitrophota bacterium]